MADIAGGHFDAVPGYPEKFRRGHVSGGLRQIRCRWIQALPHRFRVLPGRSVATGTHGLKIVDSSQLLLLSSLLWLQDLLLTQLQATTATPHRPSKNETPSNRTGTRF